MDQFSNHPLYRKHDLDSVMSSLFTFYKNHFLVLILVSFIANLAMQFIGSTVDIQRIMTITDPMEMLGEIKGMMWPMLGSLAINLILAAILQYYVLYKPIDGSVNIFVSIVRSLKYLLPLIVIMIFFAFFAAAAMIAGLIVFIIGILFSILYVSMIAMFLTPVLMSEGNNIGNAIGRSFSLSHRHFGSNLGWTAIILLIVIVGSIILSSIILIPFSGNFLKMLTNPEEAGEAMKFMTNPVYIILSAVVSSLFTPVVPIFGSILYFNAIARENNVSEVSGDNNEPEKVRVEDLYAKPYSEDHPDNPDNKQ
jgi:hypothetical protein